MENQWLREQGSRTGNNDILKKRLGIAFLAVFASFFVFFGCRKNDASDPGKEHPGRQEDRLSVAVTLFPYYDFARAVGGEYVELKLILPPGQESHSFEPTAADLIAMQDADVLIYNGGESEYWVRRVLETDRMEHVLCLAGMDVVSLYEEERSKHMQQTLFGALGNSSGSDDGYGSGNEPEEQESAFAGEEAEYDEHIWTSPVNAIRLVEAVRDTLTEAAPAYRQEFASNAEAYIRELEELDAEFRRTVAEGNRDLLLFADRFPFLYFVREYGLNYDAAFSGCGSHTEPSAATIAGLVDRIREEGIPVVYYLEQSSQKTAEILREATGVEMLLFHSCHTVTAEELESGVTYVELMRRNLENLRKGLLC